MENIRDYYGDDDFDEDYDESCLDSCPQCQRWYDEIDYDYQACSKCGYDAGLDKYVPELKREPTDHDYMNGDADILTGRWY